MYDSRTHCLQACPVGWDLFDERCYLWVTNQTKSWSDAENFCQNEGGHLVSVTNEGVNDYMLIRVGQRQVWIGANDQRQEGTWEWTDSSTFKFTDWAPGQPGKERSENCAEFYNTNEYQRGWNDLDCEASLNFVCTRNICSGKDVIHNFTNRC